MTEIFHLMMKLHVLVLNEHYLF